MAGSIILPIVSVFQNKGIKDATNDLNKFGGAISGVQGMLKGLAAGVGVGFLAHGAWNFLKESTTQARDYQRELKALETIFGSAAPEMQKFAKNSASIGLTTTESAKASVFLGSVLKQSGFSMGKVSNETKRLVSLASDLATVYGYDVSEALTGMTALFRGEYDPIEKFGVAMKQAEVNALLLERGQKNLTGGALRQAQAQARLDLLYQRSADSQGAFARGQGTLFVEQRNLAVAFDNFQAQVAQALIPALAKMMGLIGDFVTSNGPKLTSIFEGFAKVVDEIFIQLQDNQSDLSAVLNMFIDLVDVLKNVAIFVVRNIKAFAALAVTVGVLVGGFKAYAAISTIVTGLSYASEGAIVALNYALGVTITEATILTGGLLLVVAALAGVAVATSSASDAMVELTREAENLGVIQKNQAFVSRQYTSEYLANLQQEIDKVKALNKSEEYRFLLRHNEWVLSQKKAADDKANAAAAADDFAKKVAQYKAGFKDLLSAVSPEDFATRTMGQFEASVSKTFRNIYDQIHAGLTDGLLSQKAHDQLIGYAKDEASVLGDIARARDNFSNRYSLAKTLIADTKNAILDFASVSNLMSDTGKEVTKSTSYMVGKFRVTTTETLKSVTSATTIIDKYKGILASAKTFAANIAKLKGMNLSADLQKQILGAGLDQGAAMAQALVEGGPKAVNELNGLFADLSSTGASLGETVATSLYGDGVDMSQGLLKGLESAVDDFAKAGEDLAASFETGFTSALGKALSGKGFKIPGIDTSIVDTLMKKYFPETPKVSVPSKVNTSGTKTPVSSYTFGVGGVPQQTSVNVNINAGVIPDPVAAGKAIVDVISKYGRVNGGVTFA